MKIAINAITDNDKQYQMALRMIEKGATVRDFEKNVNYKKNMKKKDEKYEEIFRDIENSFQGFFGTKVKLEPGKRKGKIIIEYASNDDLERILDLVK